MSTAKHLAALTLTTGLLAIWATAWGQASTAGQADFDRCNREAQAAVSSGAPSASPGAGTAGGVSSGTYGTGPSTSGSMSSTPSTGAGVSSGTTPAPDPTLRGMATAGMKDPAYQKAYRDCMTRK